MNIAKTLIQIRPEKKLVRRPSRLLSPFPHPLMVHLLIPFSNLEMAASIFSDKAETSGSKKVISKEGFGKSTYDHLSPYQIPNPPTPIPVGSRNGGGTGQHLYLPLLPRLFHSYQARCAKCIPFFSPHSRWP